MKETTVEVEDSKITVGPSTKQKVMVTVAQTVVGLAVTAVAGVITAKLNDKVHNLIVPDQES